MDTKVSDFLTKQLFIENNVVTFRSLSRQFNLHVNTAKNELATFYNASKSSPAPAYATYLLSGEVAPAPRPTPSPQDEGIDVDMDAGDSNDIEPEDDGDVVPLTRVTLVSENDLENAKAQYTRLFSEHIYSLSPAPLTDAGLVCAPAEKVHAADAKVPLEAAVLLGRIVAPTVHMGKPMPVASSSKKAPAPVARTDTIPVAKSDADVKPKIKAEKTSALKNRPSGTLDWSKAKPKQKDEPKDASVKEKKEDKAKVKAKAPVKEDSEKEEKVVKEKERRAKETETKKAKAKVDVSGSESEVDVKEEKKIVPKAKKEAVKRDSLDRTASIKMEAKRGTKRRSLFSAQTSDSEDGASGSRSTATPPTTSRAKVKKRVVLSDEDDDESNAPRRPKNGGSYKTPAKRASNKSLRAMMDIDDDEVIKVSHRAELSSSPEVPPTTEADDSEMVEDSEPERIQPKPRKKKEKKAVPIGSNGVKKRRIMKSRSTTDDKGYFVTEDYSSYESVDGDEEPEPVKPKGKKGATSKAKKAADSEKAKPKAKAITAESSRTTSKSSNTSGGAKGKKIVGSTKATGQGSIAFFMNSKPS
ncbi:DNA polymerase subunit Cdc27 [Amylocystis lapponica]|nr:DNA polymerase subunit Cdc27 [Amylocystis lapponica]